MNDNFASSTVPLGRDRETTGDAARALSLAPAAHASEASGEAPRTPRWLRMLSALALLAIGAAGAGWLYVTRPVPAPAPVAERVWAMRVLPVAYAPAELRIRALGTVSAGRTARLRPLVSGRIVEVSGRLRDGARVEAGELLLKIDPFDYEAAVADAEAALAEAQARLEEVRGERRNESLMATKLREQVSLRQRDVERVRTLRRTGTASQQVADEAAIALNMAEQSVQGAAMRADRLAARQKQLQAALSAVQVRLDRAQRDAGEVTLRAPFAGYVTDVDAAVGKQVSTADPVARLIAEDSLEVEFAVDSGEYESLLDAGGTLAGRKAEVLWRVGSRELRYAATLDRVAAEIDPASGGITLIATIGGPLGAPATDSGTRRSGFSREWPAQPAETSSDDLSLHAAAGVPGSAGRSFAAEAAPTGSVTPPTSLLRPGAFVEVTLSGRAYESVVRVPDSAVTAEGDVYRVDGAGDEARLAVVPVTVVAREGESLLITPAAGAALPAGTPIVRDVFPGVAPGIRVRALAPDA